METRLIPVIDSTGSRQYLDAPGRSYFEAAYHLNSLLGDVVRVDKDLLLLNAEEVWMLDKQTEIKSIRRDLRVLYQEKIEVLKAGNSATDINESMNSLSVRLFKIERADRRNEPLGIGKYVGNCTRCGREAYDGRAPRNTEEGLFCNYSCRSEWRREQKQARK
ncbi:hypothetical protein [Paenibacillus medicaginis]|uniref:TRASH domain-containing protein n=1 Tax=Paenibacillus medicaginis TaxID=1470560 RepID=A0ABV5C0L2_9BACL